MMHSRTRLFASALFAAVCLLPGLCFGGENIIKAAVSEAGYLASSPARLDRAHAYSVLGWLGAGMLVYSLDGQIRHIAARNRTASLDDLSKQTEKLGNGAYDLGIAGALAGAGYLFRDEKLKDTSLTAIESFLAANAVGTVVKFTAGRSRPYAGDGKKVFRPFHFKTSGTSFPSGHTVSAFAMASVFAESYDNFWLDFSVYGAASAVAMQRVYADKHWISDVLGGAVLGVCAGRAAVSRSRGRAHKIVRIFPVYRPGYSGVLASAGF